MHQGHSPTTAGKARREIKKRCKSGIYVDSIQLEDLLRVTHLPSGQAARTLGLGITRAAAAAAGNAAVEDTGSGVASPTPSRTPSAADRQLAASASQGGLGLLLSAATVRDFAFPGHHAGAGAQGGVGGPAGIGAAAVLPHGNIPDLAGHPELLELAKALCTNPNLASLLEQAMVSVSSTLQGTAPEQPSRESPALGPAKGPPAASLPTPFAAPTPWTPQDQPATSRAVGNQSPLWDMPPGVLQGADSLRSANSAFVPYGAYAFRDGPLRSGSLRTFVPARLPPRPGPDVPIPQGSMRSMPSVHSALPAPHQAALVPAASGCLPPLPRPQPTRPMSAVPPQYTAAPPPDPRSPLAPSAADHATLAALRAQQQLHAQYYLEQQQQQQQELVMQHAAQQHNQRWQYHAQQEHVRHHAQQLQHAQRLAQQQHQQQEHQYMQRQAQALAQQLAHQRHHAQHAQQHAQQHASQGTASLLGGLQQALAGIAGQLSGEMPTLEQLLQLRSEWEQQQPGKVPDPGNALRPDALAAAAQRAQSRAQQDGCPGQQMQSPPSRPVQEPQQGLSGAQQAQQTLSSEAQQVASGAQQAQSEAQQAERAATPAAMEGALEPMVLPLAGEAGMHSPAMATTEAATAAAAAAAGK
ncbi:hypothetical protein N2152v2_000182 [Parachlorella kessleri]